MSEFYPPVRRNRWASTLINLSVITFCVLVTLMICGNLFSSARPNGGRRNDGANLKGIFTGLAGYADDNLDTYPKYATDFHSPGANAHGFNASLNGNTTLNEDEIQAQNTNNISAALWLMCRHEYLQPKIFINPRSSDSVNPIARDLAISDYLDFESSDHLSYSSINFYAANIQTKWSTSLGPESVVMGNDNDGLYGKSRGKLVSSYMNSTNKLLKEANSTDHDGAGQHFLYADGHVEFKNTPMATETDNAYTWNQSDTTPNDTQSIQLLRSGVQARTQITATTADPVKLRHIKGDTFLLPVNSLKNN